MSIVLTATRAAAQDIDTYLPPLTAGENIAPGVTVMSRLRPGYDPIGMRLGDWVLRPDLTETTGYNSNVTGVTSGAGSSFVRTQGNAAMASLGADQRVSASVSLDDLRYLDVPLQSYTNWTASLGGTYTLGRGEATVTYSHLDLHVAPSDFAALPADRPVDYRVEDLQASYSTSLGRLTLTPLIDVRHFSFDNAIVLGVPVDLGSYDHDVITAGAAARYPLSDRRNLVIVAESIDSLYQQPAPGQPVETSYSGRLLFGLDDGPIGPWRYRLLAGAEVRGFAAAAYPARVAPIVEGSIIWTLNGQTTATMSLSRTIEDPADAGVAGYIYTRGRLTVDRELRRNLLLRVTGGAQAAEYLQGGITQTNLLFGASLTRLLNRHARLDLSYSFNDQRGAEELLTAGGSAPSARLGGSYDRSIIALSLKLAL